jgi:hypothetical protein
LQVVDELHRRGLQGYVPAAAFLNAYLGTGDTEQAFVWLERAAVCPVLAPGEFLTLRTIIYSQAD